MDNNNEREVNIELSPETASGNYSNLAIISHSHSEFILDFARMLPGLVKPQVCSRILMTPEHAKRLLNALSDNISKYENQFGTIDMGVGQKNTFNLNDLVTGNGSKS